MLGDHKFDEWAKDYDLSVKESKEEYEYPFAGYDELIDEIYNMFTKGKKLRILDIGFGTGKLTQRLYNDDHKIFGIDFSDEMITIAKGKMPNSELIKWDFNNGMPSDLDSYKFDFIVSTYAIHHLENNEKAAFINNLASYLDINGIIAIGDVAFNSRGQHNECMNNNKTIWDYEECYLVFEEIESKLKYRNKAFKPISFCAGILKLMN